MASQEEDRTNRIELVKNCPGFKALNMRVNDLLRGWVRVAILYVVHYAKQNRQAQNGSRNRSISLEPGQYPSNIALSDEEFAKFVSNIGVLFQTHGENSQALALAYHQMALDAHMAVGDKKWNCHGVQQYWSRP
jgi:hypothetical protein